jgi:hypothetical protein
MRAADVLRVDQRFTGCRDVVILVDLERPWPGGAPWPSRRIAPGLTIAARWDAIP